MIGMSSKGVTIQKVVCTLQPLYIWEIREQSPPSSFATLRSPALYRQSNSISTPRFEKYCPGYYHTLSWTDASYKEGNVYESDPIGEAPRSFIRAISLPDLVYHDTRLAIHVKQVKLIVVFKSSKVRSEIDV